MGSVGKGGREKVQEWSFCTGVTKLQASTHGRGYKQRLVHA